MLGEQHGKNSNDLLGMCKIKNNYACYGDSYKNVVTKLYKNGQKMPVRDAIDAVFVR